MSIVLNAGASINGEMPSIGDFGESDADKNSLFGNFGDLLNIISADAEKAVLTNNTSPQITEKQTMEALVLLAEDGNGEAKELVASIIKRLHPDVTNLFDSTMKTDIKTDKFLEAKIENKLEQQGLLKPTKIIEFLSLADLKVFQHNFLDKTLNSDADYKNNSATSDIDPKFVTLDAQKKYVVPGEIKLTNSSDFIRTVGLPVVTVPMLGFGLGADTELNSNAFPNTKYKKTLDLVTNILQVNTGSLIIGKASPSEIIFDIRDFKDAIAVKFGLPNQDINEVKINTDLIVPYTLPVQVENQSIENPLSSSVVHESYTIDVAKISLDGKLIELPISSSNPDLNSSVIEPKSFTVKAGELSLSSDEVLERKLVVGMIVPKDTTIIELPDFVKIQIELDGETVSANPVLSNHNIAKALADPVLPDHNITKASDDQVGSDHSINKVKLISNTISIPKGELATNEPRDLISNMLALVKALNVESDGNERDIRLVSIDRSSNVLGHFLPEITSKKPINLEQFSYAQSTQPHNVWSAEFKSRTITEYMEPKVNLIDQDERPMILNSVFLNEFDMKKYTTLSLATTSSLAQGSNLNFFIAADRGLKNIELKEKISNFIGKNKKDSQTDSIFELLNNKNTKTLHPENTETKNLLLPKDNTPLPPQMMNTSINSLQVGNERNAAANHIPLPSHLATNKISLYEAQYASRLGMAVVENVKTGRENFDILLQPESFGRIKVNVSLDFRAIDVRIFTETLGAAAIFKDHENTLQQIMEQNGMKLASFSVGSQSGNEQRQFANQNKDRTALGKANGRDNKLMSKPNTTENPSGEQSGLNLIA